MTNQKEIFLKKSKIAFDLKHRNTIRHNISKYDEAVAKGKTRYIDFELAKERASYIKNTSINNLGDYLEEFEKNSTSNGASVLWARDSGEAISHIKEIILQNPSTILAKSKSMVTEEIEFNEEVEKLGIKPIETDLGEFIVQEAGEKPYHILTPAMHKSKEDVAELFAQKFQTPKDANPAELTEFVRQELRKKFRASDIGVTGANFLVANVGGVGLTENEGNGLMSVAFPKIHIVLAGIERVIPSMNDLAMFFPLLATMGTGQQISAYNSLILGPRKKNETDGPEKMFVILLDNGRTNLYADEEQSDALKCIRCGACLNACPIYKNVGGYTYNTTYSGPIGSVITPFFKGFKDYGHLSYACTVCGRCSEVCPVKIPLHYLLLWNRKLSVDKKQESFLWNTGMKSFEYVFSKRSRLDSFGGKAKNHVLNLSSNIFGNKKSVPPLANQSFSKQWKNKQ